MTKLLRWLLSLTLLLTAATLWFPSPETPIVPAVPQALADPIPPKPAPTTSPTPPQHPTTWHPIPLSAASPAHPVPDIFSPNPPPLPKPQPSPPAPPIVPATTAPPPPAAPPMTWRYLGRLRPPEGPEQIYLTQGERSVPVQKGDTLDGGFVVDSLDADGIHLLYPPNQQRWVIAIPLAAP